MKGLEGIQDTLKRRCNFPFVCLLRNRRTLLLLALIAAFLLTLNVFPSLLKKEQEVVFLSDSVFPFEKENAEELFLSPNVCEREYPDLSLIQENSLMGFSSPLLMDSEVLAIMSQNDLEISKEIIEYVVKEGDSLWSIAQKFNISTDTVVWANDIKSALIRPSQKLLILPVSGIMHLVEEEDTVTGLAEKYKTEKEKIISFNDLMGQEELFVGEILIIPDGKVPFYSSISPVSAFTGLSTNNFYGQSHSFPYGQCTWWVAQKRAIPSWGNANDWLSNAAASGHSVCRGRYCIPRVGAVICLEGHRLYGHVGYVEQIKGDKVVFSEMNYIGLGRMNYRTLRMGSSLIKGYIY